MLVNCLKIKDLKLLLKCNQKSAIYIINKNFLSSYNEKQKSILNKKRSIQQTSEPSLKDFIKNANLVNKTFLNNETNDEIVSNEIFLKHIDDVDKLENDQLVYFFPKRKVFFEVHGCQMNVNDTGIFIL